MKHFIKLTEKLSDINGNYLYRLVDLDGLLKTLETLKIPAGNSWTRRSNLYNVDGMEYVSIARLQISKDKYKTLGVNFKPIQDLSEDYYKTGDRRRFEAEERNTKDMKLFFNSSQPLISITLFNYFRDNPKALAVNKMLNDREIFSDDIDFENKKRRHLYYSQGERLSQTYFKLEEYCNLYDFLFVKNDIYNFISSGRWRKELFKNDKIISDNNLEIKRKIGDLLQNLYYQIADDEKKPNSALGKLSNRTWKKYITEIGENINDVSNLSLEEIKYLYEDNPVFKAMIIDSDDIDLYKFFRIDLKNKKKQPMKYHEYKDLITILDNKFQYVPHADEVKGMHYLRQASAYNNIEGYLKYLKGMLIEDEYFANWILKRKENGNKLRKLCQQLLEDDSIKADEISYDDENEDE